MTHFSMLAQVFSQLETVTSRTQMVMILSSFFQNIHDAELSPTIYLAQASLGPPFSAPDFGINERLATRALSLASSSATNDIDRVFKRTGDLGSSAHELIGWDSQGLSINEVFNDLKRLALLSGPGSQEGKINLLADLLKSLDKDEANAVMKIILGRLRLGLGDATIMDALSRAFIGTTALRKDIDRAYNLTSDLGLVAKILAEQGPQGLATITPQPGLPVKPELAERLTTPNEIIKRMGLVWAEPKYDGIRLQVHRHGNDVHVFSRRMEDKTEMFPEIVAAAKSELTVPEAIIDGEAVVFSPETGKYQPFQITAQRRRVYKVTEMSQRYPLRLFAFDLLSVNGQDYTNHPLRERHHKLQEIVLTSTQSTIEISPGILTSNPNELEDFFDQQITTGLEGIVAKRPNSGYHAGARSYDWVKLKRGYQNKLKDTIDTVLVGYINGKGQRAKFGIGSLLSAVYDREHDRFRTVGKIGSGLSDENWIKIKELLDGYRVAQKPARVDSVLQPDVWVEPHYVVEVYADEISRSPIHTAGKIDGHTGFALRFPRMVGWIRTDKRAEDATTEEEIIKLYQMQRHPHQNHKNQAA